MRRQPSQLAVKRRGYKHPRAESCLFRTFLLLVALFLIAGCNGGLSPCNCCTTQSRCPGSNPNCGLLMCEIIRSTTDCTKNGRCQLGPVGDIPEDAGPTYMEYCRSYILGGQDGGGDPDPEVYEKAASADLSTEWHYWFRDTANLMLWVALGDDYTPARERSPKLKTSVLAYVGLGNQLTREPTYYTVGIMPPLTEDSEELLRAMAGGIAEGFKTSDPTVVADAIMEFWDNPDHQDFRPSSRSGICYSDGDRVFTPEEIAKSQAMILQRRMEALVGSNTRQRSESKPESLLQLAISFLMPSM